MQRPILSFGVAAAVLSLVAPAAAAIPTSLRKAVESAIASGDPQEIAIVAKHAKLADPAHAEAIQKLVDAAAAAPPRSVVAVADAQPTQPAAPAKPEPKLTGKGEFGGSFATGNSEYAGLIAGFTLKLEEDDWRHVAMAQLDYQESRGARTRERLALSYQPHYQFDERVYVYGLGQYEHDRALGYDNRYAVSAGIGYRFKLSDALKLDLDAGPAFRMTEFVDGETEQSAAGRGSLNLDWKATPSLSFSQALAVYVDSLNSTINGTSAVNAKLIGPLSARLSYNLQYESAPPPGRETTDTLSRASLVYAF